MSTIPVLSAAGRLLAGRAETVTGRQCTNEVDRTVGDARRATMNEGHLQYLASPEWAKTLETDLLPWIDSVGDLGDDVLEVGPGPGLTTDLLRPRGSRRLAGTNVDVIHGDAADAGLPADRFSAVTAFSMLHHMTSSAEQGTLFREVYRVLRPGGVFLGVDALDLDRLRDAHVDDTFNPIDPDTMVVLLEAVGLRDVRIDRHDYQFRFVATKTPAT
jgi:SAM-dependent methyltransferase